MANEIFLQNWIFTKFLFPFFLVFFIVFAILEKTQIFGEDRRQTNALISFIIGLIVVSVAYPKDVINNLILFLSVALVVVFVIMLLWGFASGGQKLELQGWMKWILWIGIGIAVVIALIWATGIDSGVIDLLFFQSWSKTFWTNLLFVVAVAAALAVILKKD